MSDDSSWLHAIRATQETDGDGAELFSVDGPHGLVTAVVLPHADGGQDALDLSFALRAARQYGAAADALVIPVAVEWHLRDEGRKRAVIAFPRMLDIVEPSLERVIAAVRELTDVLASLHDQGVSHGHLRRELVALTPRGVQVSGLGVAAIAARVGGPALVCRALPAPSRAPEQRTGVTLHATPEADVWALGTIVAAGVEQMGISLAPHLARLIDAATAATPAARPLDLRRWGSDVAEVLATASAALELPASAGSPPATAGIEDGVSAAPLRQSAESPTPVALEPSSSADQTTPRAPPPADEVQAAQLTRLSWLAGAAVAVGLVLLVGGAGVVAATAGRRVPATASSAVKPPPAASAISRLGPTATPPVLAPPQGAASAGAADPLEQLEAAPLPSAREPRSRAHATATLPIDAQVPVWGGAMAPVTIVIFGDLQCPHTLAALKTLLRLKGALGDELRLAFRHRPLPVHAEARAYARTAARAHELRGDGAFWQLLSAIAQGPPSAASRVVREWAHLHGLDAGQVGSWRERTESDVVVDRDLELAGRFDVRATPTVFVNGVRLDGEPSLAEVRAVWARERSAVRAGLALAAFSPEQAYSERVGSNLTGLGVPLADRQCVPLGSSPSRGAAAPLVTIVEFSAFGCQECSEASRAVDKLLTVHPGLIRHVWKSYVAENDAAARAPAALAFAALNEGGRETFWKLHDLLRAARDLEVPQLQGIASAAGLDGPAVMARVSRGEFSATIERDRAMAERSGVTSAPTLLVNGRPASGRDGIEELPRLIEQELIVARRLLRGGVPAERLYSAVCGDGDVRD